MLLGRKATTKQTDYILHNYLRLYSRVVVYHHSGHVGSLLYSTQSFTGLFYVVADHRCSHVGSVLYSTQLFTALFSVVVYHRSGHVGSLLYSTQSFTGLFYVVADHRCSHVGSVLYSTQLFTALFSVVVDHRSGHVGSVLYTTWLFMPVFSCCSWSSLRPCWVSTGCCHWPPPQCSSGLRLCTAPPRWHSLSPPPRSTLCAITPSGLGKSLLLYRDQSFPWFRSFLQFMIFIG